MTSLGKQELTQSVDLLKCLDLPKQLTEWEDPPRAWIDLVAAFKAGDPSQVRACLELAKQSHWTHDEWSQALIDHASSTEEDLSYEDAQDTFWEDDLK